MTGVTLYGIRNCDQVRKARKLLDKHQIEYRFHDFRADGLEPVLLDQWFKHVPWDALLNRRGTTWRKMPESTRQSIVDQQTARAAMVAEPTLIRRPVLTAGDDVLVGFSETVYARTLNLPES
ncbi:MAG: ArsC family reductase [Burkholderiaceae bacterium]